MPGVGCHREVTTCAGPDRCTRTCPRDSRVGRGVTEPDRPQTVDLPSPRQRCVHDLLPDQCECVRQDPGTLLGFERSRRSTSAHQAAACLPRNGYWRSAGIGRRPSGRRWPVTYRPARGAGTAGAHHPMHRPRYAGCGRSPLAHHSRLRSAPRANKVTGSLALHRAGSLVAACDVANPVRIEVTGSAASKPRTALLLVVPAAQRSFRFCAAGSELAREDLPGSS